MRIELMQAPARSTAFEEYLDLLIQLDALMREGQGDSEQADRIRDLMDAPWYKLTGVEHAVISEASADLYTIWDTDFYPRGNTGAFDSMLRAEVGRLAAEGQIFELLDVLRKFNKQIDPYIVAMFRADAYRVLDVPTVAIEFYSLALSFESPANRAAILLLEGLQLLNREDKALEVARKLISGGKLSLDLQVVLAQLFSDFVQSDMDAIQSCQFAIKCFRESKEATARGQSKYSELTAYLPKVAVSVANACLRVGDKTSAREHSEFAIEKGFASWGYAVRAACREMSEWNSSVADLKLGIDHGLEWDIAFEIASADEVEKKNYQNAIDLATRGLKYVSTSAVESRFHLTLAMAYALGFHAVASVQYHLSEAARLDPNNTTAVELLQNVRDSKLEFDPRQGNWNVESSRNRHIPSPPFHSLRMVPSTQLVA